MKRLSCQEVLEQLADYLDEDARAELVQQVDSHIHECSHCQVEVDTLRRTILIYRHDERVELPVSLSDKLKGALEQAYRSGKGGSGSVDV